MRHMIGAATALALIASQASAQDQTRPNGFQVAQVTYSFCTNYDGDTYIVPSGQQRHFQHCNNFFYSLQSAIGQACFSYVNRISGWPQVGASYFGITFTCP